jgi:hypothetical protein
LELDDSERRVEADRANTVKSLVVIGELNAVRGVEYAKEDAVAQGVQ